HERAYRNNRRRVRGARGKRWQRLRSERVERSFAHVCETGGGRRSWLRGLVEVSKRYLLQVAAHNLGMVMRKLFGVGTPRSLQGAVAAVIWAWDAIATLVGQLRRALALDRSDNCPATQVPHTGLPVVSIRPNQRVF